MLARYNWAFQQFDNKTGNKRISRIIIIAAWCPLLLLASYLGDAGRRRISSSPGKVRPCVKK
jgi:hypothetical protein